MIIYIFLDSCLIGFSVVPMKRKNSSVSKCHSSCVSVYRRSLENEDPDWSISSSKLYGIRLSCKIVYTAYQICSYFWNKLW